MYAKSLIPNNYLGINEKLIEFIQHWQSSYIHGDIYVSVHGRLCVYSYA